MNATIKGISSTLKYLLMRSIIILCTLSLFLLVAGITWDIANFYLEKKDRLVYIRDEMERKVTS